MGSGTGKRKGNLSRHRQPPCVDTPGIPRTTLDNRGPIINLLQGSYHTNKVPVILTQCRLSMMFCTLKKKRL